MGQSMRLNLGSGGDYREEFTNVDIREEANPDIVADITDLPFNDNTAELIIARDVLEHFWDYEQVLQEWRRVLRDDGMLVVRVPDGDTLLSDEHRDTAGDEQLEKHIYGGHTNGFDVHHRLWTHTLARSRFNENGFNDEHLEIRRLKTRPLHWHLVISAFMGDETKERFKSGHDLSRHVTKSIN